MSESNEHTEPARRRGALPTWRECFLAALTGSCADPNVEDADGVVCFAVKVANAAEETFKGKERTSR